MNCNPSMPVYTPSARQRFWPLSALVLALAWLFLAAPPPAYPQAGLAATPIQLRDHGQLRWFEVARDEVYDPQAKRVRSLSAPLVAPQGLDTADPVLYPAGQPRSLANRRILTRRILVELAPDTDASATAARLGLRAGPELAYARSHYIFETPRHGASPALAARLRTLPGVLAADPILARFLFRKQVPNDPLFEQQWGLKNTGQGGAAAGADINVTPVWPEFRGSGITIAVVDDGVEYDHPDLEANYPQTSLDRDYDYRDNDNDPKPEGDVGGNDQGEPVADSHGTATAGIAAARGANGLGGVGVAYEATLLAIRLIGGNAGEDQEAGALAHESAAVHVSNNSWGPDDSGTEKAPAPPLVRAALQAGVRDGRGGKGTIYIWAAGNGGKSDDNANYDGYNSALETLSVAALNDLGQRADYSERGACLYVCAPAGADDARPQGSITTDLVGERGYNRSDQTKDLDDLAYTAFYNGTSCAAPMVSGVVALLLQANPNLGWRDVQEILIRGATKIQPADTEWRENRAGFHFNPNFGAGLVNAQRSVELARSWMNLGAQQNHRTDLADLQIPIPDNSDAGAQVNFDVSANLRVEQAHLTVTIEHAARGQLEIQLISPGGTISPLAEPHADANANYEDWRFESVFNWGESSAGNWTLRVVDHTAGQTGTLRAARLTLYGTATTPPPSQVPSLAATLASPESLRILVQDAPQRLINLQFSTDLVRWDTVLATNPPASRFEIVRDIAPTPTAGFYRLVVP